MSCGVPVVSSDGGALPEVVGDSGIVVPVRDEIALAREINDLFDNPEKMKKMSLDGIKRVEEFFNWEKAVAQMVEIYEGCLRKFYKGGSPNVIKLSKKKHPV